MLNQFKQNLEQAKGKYFTEKQTAYYRTFRELTRDSISIRLNNDISSKECIEVLYGQMFYNHSMNLEKFTDLRMAEKIVDNQTVFLMELYLKEKRYLLKIIK